MDAIRHTATTNEIKHIEAAQLNAYLDSLTYRERVEFVTSVVKKAGVKRQTFFNWKCMACRISEQGKQIIEHEAGEHIFSEKIPAEKEVAP